MKRSMRVVTALSLAATVLAGSAAMAATPAAKERVKPVDWQAYGENLSMALRSDNLGLQRSALQTLILKGDKVKLTNGIIDVMNVYLTHENDGFRQLAIVAMQKVGDEWAMSYLRGRAHLEQSPAVKKTLLTVLNAHYQKG